MPGVTATNTIGGKNMVLHRMENHYKALSQIKAQIDCKNPKSREIIQKKKRDLKNNNNYSKNKIKKESENKNEWIHKTQAAIKEIQSKPSVTTQNRQSTHLANLTEIFNQRRVRNYQRQMNNHQKTLHKMFNAIHNINYPAVLFFQFLFLF